MAKKDWTPEERAEWRRQRAEWDRQTEEFKATLARIQARFDAERERRERRRRRLRRFLPFLPADGALS